MEQSSTPRRLSRRTVAKGAAWTVPAVAVAAPVASAATSGQVPQPGDHCYQGGQAVNAFRFYLLQPTLVGDTITISGPALLDDTTVTGVGVTVNLVSTVDGVRTYQVTAVDNTVMAPYLLIAGTNTTGSAENRVLTVTQTQAGTTSSWTKEFTSNVTNCVIFDRQ